MPRARDCADNFEGDRGLSFSRRVLSAKSSKGAGPRKAQKPVHLRKIEIVDNVYHEQRKVRFTQAHFREGHRFLQAFNKEAEQSAHPYAVGSTNAKLFPAAG
jgi:hypothetical protein